MGHRTQHMPLRCCTGTHRFRSTGRHSRFRSLPNRSWSWFVWYVRILQGQRRIRSPAVYSTSAVTTLTGLIGSHSRKVNPAMTMILSMVWRWKSAERERVSAFTCSPRTPGQQWRQYCCRRDTSGSGHLYRGTSRSCRSPPRVAPGGRRG
jgi:hypothetical protein